MFSSNETVTLRLSKTWLGTYLHGCHGDKTRLGTCLHGCHGDKTRLGTCLNGCHGDKKPMLLSIFVGGMGTICDSCNLHGQCEQKGNILGLRYNCVYVTLCVRVTTWCVVAGWSGASGVLIVISSTLLWEP